MVLVTTARAATMAGEKKKEEVEKKAVWAKMIHWHWSKTVLVLALSRMEK